VVRRAGPINLNVHFHTLVPDGVFDLQGDGPAHFVTIPPPRDEEVASILERFVRRAAKALADHDEGDPEEALAALQAAEVDRRVRYPDPFKHSRRSAFLDGFSLHAGVRVHEHDRDGLERLCRYAVRPPFALHRLSHGEEGRLVYRMKRPRGGSLWLVLTPDELIARLATLVPPPRVHAVRYHGVFAPNAKVRRRVVPSIAPGAKASEPAAPLASHSDRAPPADGAPAVESAQPARTYRLPWAELLRKVFALDVLACPECGGRLRVIAFIAQASVACRILKHLGLESQGPPIARAQAPPETFDPAPDYDVSDCHPAD